ncbi:methyltransferase domain-containing protein [Luteimonas gilva]|uniref:Methyltransferase domain-containing protein n=1 Tax=Luteimonas gilva TaxID=2572684 RepID=A0A4U5JYN2_9GAMM|nr:methyltransferase domain-containing protein [Luteimonas gilva]TKR33861.1 methyltransferase domain-containing protein [Luteimonas gilva]
MSTDRASEALIDGLPTTKNAGDPAIDRTLADVASYYATATEDYRQWSRGLNMHFGYWQWPLSPFDREAMLEALNRQAIARMAIDGDAPIRAVDLGCGAGAVARALARQHPQARITCVTIAPVQIEYGRELNADAGVAERIDMHLSDYRDTGLPSESFDRAWFVESACHADGPDKRAPLAEAHRLLKPGGRLLIADGFKRDARPLPRWLRNTYRSWCRGWAIPEMAQLDALTAALADLGFVDIRVEDVSWRMAPSFAHIPWVATRYVLNEWAGGHRLSAWRRHHARASFLSIPLGLALRHFRYCFVSASKAG